MGDEATRDFALSAGFLSLPRKRIGAGLVIVDDQRRILMVQPTYKSDWEIPGGLVESGESPRAAVKREAREELGLDLVIGSLLVIDWVAPGHLPDDGLMLVYAVEPFETSEIVLPPDELLSWEWCDLEMVKLRVPVFQYRRLALAVEALSDGQLRELENGIDFRTL